MTTTKTPILTPSPEAFTPDIYAFTSGPRDARVMIVGEAWGREEEAALRPFSGSTGYELKQLLLAAGIDRDKCLLTNVISARPPNNDFTHFLHPTAEKSPDLRGLRPRDALRHGVDILRAQIESVKPDLIIGCGNIPLWALTDKAAVSTIRGYRLPGGVTKWRGSQLRTTSDMGSRPFLPVIHPAAILREYSWKHVTVHDLNTRAGRYLRGETAWERGRKTTAYWNPTFHEAEAKLLKWISAAQDTPLALAVDIETWRKKDIVCIGFADDLSELCIPFFFFENGVYREVYKPEQELRLVMLVRQLLSSPKLQIVGQNYIYDFQFIGRKWHVHTPVTYDTMLMHHLCWPGTPKGLDYLASLYSDHYVYWKDESQDWDGTGGHEQLWKYNCKDVRETYDIHLELKRLITTLGLDTQYTFQREQWKLAAAMMRKGIAIDRHRRDVIRKEVTAAAYDLEAWLSAIMPEDLRYTKAGGHWFTSPIHSMYIFYSVLGLQPVLHKKTKQPTFNYEAFDTLRKRHPWLSPILLRLEEYRSIGVFNSHFLDISLSPDGRLRCNFNVGGTETFRWSSSANAFGEGTNFQNIPKGDE
ncbi:MAG: hypothetical protein IPK54_10165 [Dokdonella sp.]|uniref:uracil-DNA glycosylase family protein n=1 Tax=Dokdonella sp. TaxID=2291710 RepID=UPI0025C0C5F9|nr:uracil-DNA glycosylase family protein [Dokdonella sp.]MBK8123896.1 hypothetical protein [Dokdonella sp.]